MPSLSSWVIYLSMPMALYRDLAVARAGHLRCSSVAAEDAAAAEGIAPVGTQRPPERRRQQRLARRRRAHLRRIELVHRESAVVDDVGVSERAGGGAAPESLARLHVNLRPGERRGAEEQRAD
jgi:hypothetical protein